MFLLRFLDVESGRKVDITVQSLCEVFSSRLIKAYVNLDERVQQLILIIKYWNKNVLRNEPYRLNSYSLTLMVIAFMQHKKILPNLQQNAHLNPIMIDYEVQYQLNN